MSEAGASATLLYAAPAGLERPLRVVLVGPARVPGWVHAFHCLAAGNDWIEVIALAAPDAVLPRVPNVGLGMRVMVALEQALLGGNRSLAGVELPSEACGGRGEPLAARVAALHPDLVILLGPRPWATELAEHAPWGCWHIDATLTDPRYAGLALLLPMMRGETATRTELVLHGPNQASIALAGSWGRTRAPSFVLQRQDAFRKLAPLLLRALHGVAAGRVPASGCAGSLQLQSSHSPLECTSGLRVLMSTLLATARSLTERIRNRSDWMLVLRRGESPLDPQAPVIGTHALLRAPRGWWADPCLIAEKGRTLLFVEEMVDPRGTKATIACVELIDGMARRLGVALEEPGHLSFPQVLHWQGQWYLTVESNYARRVSLYRAAEFPLQWVRVADLVTDRVCVDPTLHHHDGCWYLFANVAESGNSTCDDLFLFVSESLEGPFTPHPASPIVTDVRRARMAGRLFEHEGRLIRPAQDCAPSYGRAVVFNEVLALGPSEYRERALSRLEPEWTHTRKGYHTYSAEAGTEVLDVLGHPMADAAYIPVSDDAVAEETRARQQGVHPLSGACPAADAPSSGTPPPGAPRH